MGLYLADEDAEPADVDVDVSRADGNGKERGGAHHTKPTHKAVRLVRHLGIPL